MRIFSPDLIRKRRLELGLTQQRLSEVSKMTRPYISNIENGKRLPSVKILAKIAEALKVQENYFFSDDEKKN